MNLKHVSETGEELDKPIDQFELVREGARRDGVEIVHYEPRYSESADGSPSGLEKRIERTIALFLFLSGLASLAFVVIFGFWDWKYSLSGTTDKWYTPLLGTCMAISLFGIGAAIIIWSKKLLPHEVSVQDRHDGASTSDEKELTAATLLNMGEETNIKRRPLLKVALAGGLLPIGLMAVAPLGALIKKPRGELNHTGFKKGIRLVRLDGSAIRPTDVSAGGVETVFPGIPGGSTNHHADSPTLLIHLREQDSQKVKPREGQEDYNHGNFYAFSKICTHAGCPASLYEQQTQRLLCPCHQSQFNVLHGCYPVFGPATRPLPQLSITLDDEGYFVATADYKEAIGPAFWERP